MRPRLPSWLGQHLAALRALLVLTVLLGVAYPLASPASRSCPGLKSRADGSLVTAAARRSAARLIGQSFTDAKRQPAASSTSSPARPPPAPPATTRPRPARPTSARRASSTPCRTRGEGRHRQAEPAHPGLRPQRRDRRSSRASTAAGPTAPPTASAPSSPSSTADGLTGPVTRVVSLNQACPATPFVATWRRRPRGVRQVRRGLQPRASSRPVRGDAPGHAGGPAGRRHRQRQRPRPGHQPRLRPAPGAAGRAGPAAYRTADGPRRDRRSTPAGVRSGSWASPP